MTSAVWNADRSSEISNIKRVHGLSNSDAIGFFVENRLKASLLSGSLGEIQLSQRVHSPPSLHYPK